MPRISQGVVASAAAAAGAGAARRRAALGFSGAAET